MHEGPLDRVWSDYEAGLSCAVLYGFTVLQVQLQLKCGSQAQDAIDILAEYGPIRSSSLLSLSHVYVQS